MILDSEKDYQYKRVLHNTVFKVYNIKYYLAHFIMCFVYKKNLRCSFVSFSIYTHQWASHIAMQYIHVHIMNIIQIYRYKMLFLKIFIYTFITVYIFWITARFNFKGVLHPEMPDILFFLMSRYFLQFKFQICAYTQLKSKN